MTALYLDSPVFRYSGRVISWISENTLYCDNWKLTIKSYANNEVLLAAAKTPLPSSITVRPCWSPKGDRAAYMVDVKEPGATEYVVPMRLVVVDANGKVIWRRNIYSDIGYPRWSQDGKYLALASSEFYAHNANRRYHLVFAIYEIGTDKSWHASISEDILLSGNFNENVEGWDWQYNPSNQ